MAQFEVTREFLDTIENAIQAHDNVFILNELSELHAVDVNAILEELKSKEAKYVFDLLDVELRAEIITELDPDIRVSFLKKFSPEELSLLFPHIDSDDAADILNEQTDAFRDQILDQISSEDYASDILELIHYEEGSAGSLMAKEFITANINWPVVKCIDEIRRQALNVDKIYSIYVVDDRNKLLGRVSVKRILLSTDDVRIADIYDDDVMYVEAYDTVETVTNRMSKYDLDAIPVVNHQLKLIGRITIDDVIDVIKELQEEERQLMTGLSNNNGDEAFWNSISSRLPWLLIGMVGGLLGANLIGLFETDLVAVPAMAFFIPLITATGGNVGIQSSSVVVQGLASRSDLDESWFVKIMRSLLVALVNGLAIAILVFAFNMFFRDDIHLATVISIALFSVVILASFSGTLTPLVLDKIGINPALASGPFITTTNDILGITVYFLVAKVFI